MTRHTRRAFVEAYALLLRKGWDQMPRPKSEALAYLYDRFIAGDPEREKSYARELEHAEELQAVAEELGREIERWKAAFQREFERNNKLWSALYALRDLLSEER